MRHQSPVLYCPHSPIRREVLLRADCQFAVLLSHSLVLPHSCIQHTLHAKLSKRTLDPTPLLTDSTPTPVELTLTVSTSSFLQTTITSGSSS